MSRLARVIAPLPASAGLGARTVSGADGQVRELVITSPRQRAWGRVVDREGLMERDYRGQVHDDPRTAGIATVIIAIMATRPGSDPERCARATYLAAPGECDRPHP